MDKTRCYAIFSEISKHMIEATMYHEEMTNYYDFLGLKGFKRMHEKQLYSELIGRRKLHSYFVSAENKLIPSPTSIDTVARIPAEWYNYSRKDVDGDVVLRNTEKSLKEYREWEHETLELFEGFAKELLEHGHIAHYEFVKCYVKDVAYELKRLDKLIQSLTEVEYDVIYIVEIQKEMHDSFKEKERKLFKKI